VPDPRFRVALLVESSNRYGRDLLHGIHDWMAGVRSWSVRLTEQARLAPLPEWLEAWDGDGVIARVDTDAMARALRRTGLPVVDVSAERRRSEFPRVTIDNAAVARLAAEHLRERGLRHFAFCGDARFLWSRERGRHFARALRGAGSVAPGFEFPAVEGRDDGRRLAAWLRGLPKPVGVLVSHDARAQEVLEACQRAGLEVPGQVAVLGVDNDEVVCDLCHPPLSSVLPNARRAGFEAARELHARMAEPRRRRSPRTLAIEPIRVEARPSTDLVAVGDPALAAALRLIRERAAEGIRVGDVVRSAGLSRTHLERRFKLEFGRSPHRLIVARRLEQVRQLLLESDLPVARIADLTGFVSPSYLSFAFRREQGESPLRFRQRHRAGSRRTPGI
jgi:LacI family transcriptional regulator